MPRRYWHDPEKLRVKAGCGLTMNLVEAMQGDDWHANSELIVERKTGQVRQAGASQAHGQFVELFKRSCESDLYCFLRGVMDYWFLQPELHKPVCDWLTTIPPVRKLLLMPRNHCKCLRKTQYDNEIGRLTLTITPNGQAVRSTQKAALNGVHPVWAVTTKSGRRLEITANHPFLRFGGWWQTIDEGLKVGDWVGIVRKGVFGDTHSPALAGLTGWMLADAYLPAQRVSVSDSKERARCIELAKAAGIDASETPKTPDSVAIHGMRDLWRSWGLFEARAGDKFVPSWIFHADEPTIRSFLEELVGHDGGRSGYSKDVIEYSTTSERLARDVQHLLTKFGIHSKLYHIRSLYKGEDYFHWRVAFTDTEGFFGEPVRLCGSSLTDLFPPEWRDWIPRGSKGVLRRAGIRIDNKYHTTRSKVRRVANMLNLPDLREWCDNDIAWEPIVSIEYLGKAETIAVETPEHTLTAGDIVSHNTTLVARGLPLHAMIQPKKTNLYFPGEPGCNLRLVLSGETEEMAVRNLRVIKTALEGNLLLRALWPHLIWENPRRQAAKWSDDMIIIPRKDVFGEPTIRAIGVGGAVTGMHPNLIVKDDLTTQRAANEPPTMSKAIEWHSDSRALFANPDTDLEFITGTYWANFDLPHFIEEKDPTVEVNKDWRSITHEGKIIYPQKYGYKGAVEQLQREHGIKFPLLFMNQSQGEGLTDFLMSDIRDYELRGGKLHFDEDDRDVALDQAARRSDVPEERARRGMDLYTALELSNMEYLRNTRSL